MPPAPSPPPAPRWSLRLFRAHLLLAHLSLFAALAWTALRPEGLAGTALHPDVYACVHLVTLGCLATACVGSFHVVLPLAMATTLPADWRDWLLLTALQLVATGVASHMALGTYSGVSWSAGLLAAALLLQLGRYLGPLRRAKAPAAVRWGSGLAFVDLLLAVLLGGALAIQHLRPLLPNELLASMFAHAHLALGGFVGTLVAAVGIRLLPMFLPALPPPAPLAGLAVAGLGLGGALCGAGALWPPALDPGLWLVFAGGGVWLGSVAAMLLRRRPPRPPAAPELLPAHLLLATAVASFVVALVLGALLHAQWLGPPWWPVYGFCLLIGGFGTLVLGIGQRLMPLAVRMHAGPLSTIDAHRLPSRTAAWATAGSWLAGCAVAPFAIAGHSAAGVRIAAGLTAVAVAIDGWNLWRKRGTPPPSDMVIPRP